ncbi:SulP family inorganic anion transporter [Neolewinella antarctica]|uniref:SulP family sulfate permease n=1 Tax=Neolewinella antarctica TaxID=442734 RepID=A0ABX0XFX5_9BACT|nr:sulfate permease [Neolewinella antarctica]NJC27678.1 SulP family sulfate permease [Neolewinella antarctica]
MRIRLDKWFPAPPDFGRATVVTDLVAGLTVGVLLVPQAMAYALLAGVPPVYGLYAALVPLVGYALFASSPHTSVGPTALASLLCLNGIAGLAQPGSETFIGYAILLGGLTGVLQLLFGLLRFGGIGSLLSRPVLSGFVSAAAVLIMFSQADALLGVRTERTRFFHDTVLELARNVGALHLPSAALGLLTLLLLLLAGKFLPKKFPTMLVLIVTSTALIALVGADWGVKIVGAVPSGLPGLAMPVLSWEVVLELLPVAAVIALLSFIETLSIGKAFSPRHQHYRIEPNRELVALGFSKLLGMFFQAIPSSASFSRSAVGEGAGALTPLSSLFTAGLLVLVLLFLTPLFYYLPIPVLAALIIYSVRKLFDVAEMKRLWKLAPKEFATLAITFLFTLFAGLQYGVAGGVVLSLYFVFARAARPHMAELGRVPGTNAFRNCARFAAAETDPGILIMRFDAELYFGNADFFRQQLERFVDARGEALRSVIIDAHTINDLDTSGLFSLSQFLDVLDRRGVELYLCGVIGPVRDMLYKSGMMERMGAAYFFLSIQDALTHIAEERGDRGWDLPAVQHR